MKLQFLADVVRLYQGLFKAFAQHLTELVCRVLRCKKQKPCPRGELFTVIILPADEL